MVKITIITDNAAFGYLGTEVARILKEIAKDFESDTVKSSYRDINGNTVCKVS